MKLIDIFSKEKPFFIVAFGFVWQILFFYIPLLFIVGLSLVKISESGIYEGLWLGNFKFFLKADYFLIIAKSLCLALITVFLCFIVGYPLAHFIAFKSGRFKNFFLFLLILPFWTNFLLHIYAWFYVLEKSGFLNNFLLYLGIINKPLSLLNSFWSVLVVMLYCYLPFMVLPVYSILEKINKNIIEASADLGASNIQTWIRIILPLSSIGIKSGFFLVFVPSFGEFAIPGLVGGEKYMFVGSVISRFILGTATITYGVAFTILSCAVLILFLVFIYYLAYKFFIIKGNL